MVGLFLALLAPRLQEPEEVEGVKARQEKSLAADRPTADEPLAYLVLQWPERERADARLEIDGQPRDLSGPQIESGPEEIKIAVRPGLHKVWIGRRGFEPIEDLVAHDHAEAQIL